MKNKRAKLISAGGMFDHIHLFFTAVNYQHRRFCKRCEIQFLALGARIISPTSKLRLAVRLWRF